MVSGQFGVLVGEGWGGGMLIPSGLCFWECYIFLLGCGHGGACCGVYIFLVICGRCGMLWGGVYIVK